MFVENYGLSDLEAWKLCIPNVYEIPIFKLFLVMQIQQKNIYSHLLVR